jgi:4-diphosphocytidyl-2-C-methyl-D-erythritol kinase
MPIIRSYAKLNLFLRVIGKQGGYHLLQSLMQTIDLHDEITFEESKDFHFSASNPLLSNDNLIVKAFVTLQNDFPQIPDQKITLIKNIPVAAGLGGGSSNAAATLNYLNQKYALKLSTQKLKDYAAALGSDVPFFIEGGTQLAEGRGELLTVLPELPEKYFLLVNPNKLCPTGAVFKNVTDFTDMKNYSELETDISKFFQFLVNDLTLPAMKVVPEIKIIIDHLKAARGCEYAGLSGSGATCFAVFSNKADSQNAYNAWDEPRHYKVLCQSLNVPWDSKQA